MVGEVESYGIHGRDTEQNPVSEIKEGLENSLEVQGFPCGSAGKESACNVEVWVRSLGWEDPLEQGMTTYSSILAWRIPMDRGAWWAAVHWVTKNRTRLSD